MPESKDLHPLVYKGLKIVPFGISIGVALLIAGICCLCIQETIRTRKTDCDGFNTTYGYKHIQSINYWNCTTDQEEYCFNSTLKPCICSVPFTVNQDIEGDVIIAYKLDTFFSSNGRDETFKQSKDENQLKGILEEKVSPACSPYDYGDGRKPIAPCGALADAMFNDTLSGILTNEPGLVPKVPYGLLHPNQKYGFKNPQTDDLAAAFKNFTKPRNWTKNLWELDETRPENNGFENEDFIVWMRPDWEVRPLWRLDRNTTNSRYAKGIPADDYSFSIFYNYPYSVYSGPRQLIIYQEYPIENPICSTSIIETQTAVSYGVGIAGVVIGVMLLVVSIALVVVFKVKVNNKSEMRNRPVKSTSSRNSTNQDPVIISQRNGAGQRGDTEQQLISKPQAIAEEEDKEQKPLNYIDEDYL